MSQGSGPRGRPGSPTPPSPAWPVASLLWTGPVGHLSGLSLGLSAATRWELESLSDDPVQTVHFLMKTQKPKGQVTHRGHEGQSPSPRRVNSPLHSRRSAPRKSFPGPVETTGQRPATATARWEAPADGTEVPWLEARRPGARVPPSSRRGEEARIPPPSVATGRTKKQMRCKLNPR